MKPKKSVLNNDNSFKLPAFGRDFVNAHKDDFYLDVDGFMEANGLKREVLPFALRVALTPEEYKKLLKSINDGSLTLINASILISAFSLMAGRTVKLEEIIRYTERSVETRAAALNAFDVHLEDIIKQMYAEGLNRQDSELSLAKQAALSNLAQILKGFDAARERFEVTVEAIKAL